MSRVCRGKQSVAERASAHRTRVRDLAAILTPVYMYVCMCTSQHRERNAVATKHTAVCYSDWDISSLFRDVRWDDRAGPPLCDLNIGLAGYL